jgi:OOP family OmpA-OmpF porin
VASPPQKITFSADAMFSFDQSKLKPEGETMLQGLVNQLHSSNYENVMLTGHTDRIGSAVYNQKLSERRALEVKKYLVGQNIPSDRIETQGVGETQPLESTKDCKGGQSAKIIACLQADRRVDVEMKGTKK